MRYFYKKSQISAVNYMSILSVIGVVFSSAAMFVVLSGFSGLKNYSLEFISSVSPELKISAKRGKSFEFTDDMRVFLESQECSFSKSYEDKALISVNNNNRILNIIGVDENYPKKNIDSIIYEGLWFQNNLDEVVVGLGAAYDLGISTQDALNPLTVYVPKSGKGQVFSEKDVFRSKKAIMSGVFSVNEELDNNTVFMSLESIKSLYGLGERDVGAINIFKTDDAVWTKEAVADFFGPEFVVRDKVQQNITVYKMLNTEEIAIYLIFSLIVVVALFNMFGALMMMVVEKRNNLLTLMVLGLVKSEVGKIFFYQGLLICITGCFFGLLAGSALVGIQQKYSLFMIAPDLAYPVVFEVKSFLVVIMTVLMLGLIASSIVSFYVKKNIPQIS